MLGNLLNSSCAPWNHGRSSLQPDCRCQPWAVWLQCETEMCFSSCMPKTSQCTILTCHLGSSSIHTAFYCHTYIWWMSFCVALFKVKVLSDPHQSGMQFFLISCFCFWQSISACRKFKAGKSRLSFWSSECMMEAFDLTVLILTWKTWGGVC